MFEGANCFFTTDPVWRLQSWDFDNLTPNRADLIRTSCSARWVLKWEVGPPPSDFFFRCIRIFDNRVWTSRWVTECANGLRRPLGCFRCTAPRWHKGNLVRNCWATWALVLKWSDIHWRWEIMPKDIKNGLQNHRSPVCSYFEVPIWSFPVDTDSSLNLGKNAANISFTTKNKHQTASGLE